jgi:hypothetical protein
MKSDEKKRFLRAMHASQSLETLCIHVLPTRDLRQRERRVLFGRQEWIHGGVIGAEAVLDAALSSAYSAPLPRRAVLDERDLSRVELRLSRVVALLSNDAGGGTHTVTTRH